jgi:hypothetical protein
MSIPKYHFVIQSSVYFTINIGEIRLLCTVVKIHLTVALLTVIKVISVLLGQIMGKCFLSMTVSQFGISNFDSQYSIKCFIPPYLLDPVNITKYINAAYYLLLIFIIQVILIINTANKTPNKINQLKYFHWCTEVLIFCRQNKSIFYRCRLTYEKKLSSIDKRKFQLIVAKKILIKHDFKKWQ